MADLKDSQRTTKVTIVGADKIPILDSETAVDAEKNKMVDFSTMQAGLGAAKEIIWFSQANSVVTGEDLLLPGSIAQNSPGGIIIPYTATVNNISVHLHADTITTPGQFRINVNFTTLAAVRFWEIQLSGGTVNSVLIAPLDSPINFTAGFVDISVEFRGGLVANVDSILAGIIFE